MSSFISGSSSLYSTLTLGVTYPMSFVPLVGLPIGRQLMAQILSGNGLNLGSMYQIISYSQSQISGSNTANGSSSKVIVRSRS